VQIMPTDQLILVCSTIFLIAALAIAARYSVARGREALAFRELQICEAREVRAGCEADAKVERKHRADQITGQLMEALMPMIAGFYQDWAEAKAEAKRAEAASKGAS
jgi:hypothetical protein